ncbi:hypothetical protein [Calidifontibacillus erzurumensis]|uniref:hypothetical protein n=1 Tax=Calidifontibacillus erzurumensis TaxID=2741433 RepID=UPI0035B5436D
MRNMSKSNRTAKYLMKNGFLNNIDLFNMLKDLPQSISQPVMKLFQIKDHHERMAFLKTLPEDLLRALLKASVYLILSSGTVLKESLYEVYLTPEIKTFLDKVKLEVDKAGELTKETVSKAVDIALGTVTVITYIGLISLSVFLILNPTVSWAILFSFLCFPEMLLFLFINEKEKDEQESKK